MIVYVISVPFCIGIMALKRLNRWLLYILCGVVTLCVVVVYNMERYNNIRDINPLYQQTEDTNIHSILGKFYVQCTSLYCIAS